MTRVRALEKRGGRPSVKLWSEIASPHCLHHANCADYSRVLRPAKSGSGDVLHRSNPEALMSALGHKRTSADVKPMSALPPKADIDHHNSNVRFVPKADMRRGKQRHYSITRLASARRFGGISRPIAFAVFRLRTNSNAVGCWMGKSAGLAPFKILSTKMAAVRKNPFFWGLGAGRNG
jgi:hypothetical protein